MNIGSEMQHKNESFLIHVKIHYFLTCCIAFILPFKYFASPFIFFLLLNWIIEGDFRNKMVKIKSSRILLLLLPLYLFHIVGLLWSTDLIKGFFDLQVKLSLIVFPIIFSCSSFGSKEVNKIINFFIFGCFAVCLFLLGHAAFLSFQEHINHFFYVGLAFFLHPSYLSMYLNFAIFYLLIALSINENQHWRWYFLLIFFIIMIILLGSKIAYIILFITIVAWAIWIIIKKKKYKIALVSVILLVIVIGVVAKYSNTMSDRINTSLSTLLHFKETIPSNAESTSVRKYIWFASLHILEKRPLFGTGTGSSQRVLIEQYKEEGINRALDKNLNAHNAYCQIMVSLGFVGLILLLMNLFLPLIRTIREGNLLYLLFVLLMTVNFIPESMLETQAGTMFYGFFQSLLIFSSVSKFYLGFRNR